LRRFPLRAGVYAAALGTSMTGAAAVPAAAQTDDPKGTAASAPTASIARVAVGSKRLNVKAGRRAVVRGRVHPAARGYVAALQVLRDGRWRTLDTDRTGGRGRYVLRDRRPVPGSLPARVRVRGASDRSKRRIGRLNVYRYALASWYGPGLYGRRTGCGGTLGYGRLGVAHKTLPCGSKVTLRHRGRRVRVKVIDRGPYVGAREYDLTEATARRLRFRGHGNILVTR
jgi:rare lipoprotein A